VGQVDLRHGNSLPSFMPDRLAGRNVDEQPFTFADLKKRIQNALDG
jgi:hypothetical protein